jgi:hypothetical protein
MSFIPAVRREIGGRQPNDPIRLVLEFLLQNGVGRSNSKPIGDIITHLQANGVNITPTVFQQTILSDSRSSDYYIGSGSRGYFLIDNRGDAERMRDFYESRIIAEQANLDNLRRQAQRVGWQI